MRFTIVLASVLIATSLTGCRLLDEVLAEPTKRAAEMEVAEATSRLQGEITTLRKAIAMQQLSLENQRIELDGAITALKREVELGAFLRKHSENNYKRASASVTADSGGYGVARTDIGPALVLLKGASPYLDGFKVKLWIAILAPITVNGLKVGVWWTETDAAFQEKPGQSFRTKEFTVTDRFAGGRYSEIELALTPASAGGVKKLTVALEVDRVSVALPGQP